MVAVGAWRTMGVGRSGALRLIFLVCGVSLGGLLRASGWWRSGANGVGVKAKEGGGATGGYGTRALGARCDGASVGYGASVQCGASVLSESRGILGGLGWEGRSPGGPGFDASPSVSHGVGEKLKSIFGEISNRLINISLEQFRKIGEEP